MVSRTSVGGKGSAGMRRKTAHAKYQSVSQRSAALNPINLQQRIGNRGMAQYIQGITASHVQGVKNVPAKKSQYTINQSVDKKGITTIERLDANGKVVGSLSLKKGVTLKTNAFRDQLLDLSQFAKGRNVEVISGFRDQSSQKSLIAAGNPRAAKRSQHTVGLAADIRIAGQTAKQASITAFHSGIFNRVNLYTTSNSVHVDQRPGYSAYYSIDWVKQKSP